MYILRKLSKLIIVSHTKRYFCTDLSKFKPPYKVLFFGTDQFSLESLKALTIECRKKVIIDRLEVVTTFKSKPNKIYSFSAQENIILHQWPLTNEINGFDLGLVVSFGYLIPEKIINSFPLGMLNVHASLLPRWRGAAPIIYALANGDAKTGVSIMKVKPKHFDIGEILNQAEIEISSDTTQVNLYKNLSELGAKTLIETLYNLHKLKAQKQSEIGVTNAPKIKSNFANVIFNKMIAIDVYNLSRALDGLYPLNTKCGNLPIKLYNVKLCSYKNNSIVPGGVVYDKKDKTLKIMCSDHNFISVKSLGIVNKKIMNAEEFNNGYLRKIPNKLFC
ncbi:methionyl-tRNA formyltransferase, mitochondrial [Onthophagus taurus]|uniref:methionyl-tRNA formyltransferase, mitochondrial n=1 Tax=Onthophagus taurus TaxID=166361 RepID=UPI000C20F44F|nr:methionyl-tRNA formyltransferase, mitochondrial [Onthophagus taurus]